MPTRKTLGYVAATLALLLLAGLAAHAFFAQAETVTPRLLGLALTDVMLWMLALRLTSDSGAYVNGVRETVDRLASALHDRPR